MFGDQNIWESQLETNVFPHLYLYGAEEGLLEGADQKIYSLTIYICATNNKVTSVYE